MKAGWLNELRGLRTLLVAAACGLMALGAASRVEFEARRMPSEILTLVYWGISLVLGCLPFAQEFDNRTLLLGLVQPISRVRILLQKFLAALTALAAVLGGTAAVWWLTYREEAVPWEVWFGMGLSSVFAGPWFALLGRNVALGAALNFLGQAVFVVIVWLWGSLQAQSMVETSTWLFYGGWSEPDAFTWWIFGSAYGAGCGVFGYLRWWRFEVRDGGASESANGFLARRGVLGCFRMGRCSPALNLWRKELVVQRWAILAGLLGGTAVVLLRLAGEVGISLPGVLATLQGILLAGTVVGVPIVSGVAAGSDRATGTQHLNVVQPVGRGRLRIPKVILCLCVASALGFALPIGAGMPPVEPLSWLLTLGIVLALATLGFLISTWSDSPLSALLRTFAAAALLLLVTAAAGILVQSMAVRAGVRLADERIAQGVLDTWQLELRARWCFGLMFSLPLVAAVLWLRWGSRNLSLAHCRFWPQAWRFGVSTVVLVLLFSLLLWGSVVPLVAASTVGQHVAEEAQKRVEQQRQRGGPPVRHFRVPPPGVPAGVQVRTRREDRPTFRTLTGRAP